MNLFWLVVSRAENDPVNRLRCCHIMSSKRLGVHHSTCPLPGRSRNNLRTSTAVRCGCEILPYFSVSRKGREYQRCGSSTICCPLHRWRLDSRIFHRGGGKDRPQRTQTIRGCRLTRRNPCTVDHAHPRGPLVSHIPVAAAHSGGNWTCPLALAAISVTSTTGYCEVDHINKCKDYAAEYLDKKLCAQLVICL
jgi:hypothetical protein